jgi:hypothetical protein
VILRPKNINPLVRQEINNSITDSAQPELYASPAITEDTTPEPTNLMITRLLEEGYKADSWWKEIQKEITKPDGIPHSKVVPLSEYELVDDRLLFRGRIYVPLGELRTTLAQIAHDSCESGHPGKNKLYALLSRDYW